MNKELPVAYSFRTRLTVSLALFGILITVCVTGVYYLQVRSALFKTLDDALKSVVKAEIASAIDDSDRGLHIHDVPGPEVVRFDTGLEEVAWIMNAEGRVFAQSRNIADGDIDQIVERLSPLAVDTNFSDQVINEIPYRLLVAGMTLDGKLYFQALGLSREPVLERLTEIRGQLLLIVVAAGILLPLVSYILSRRLTEPILGLTRQLGRVDSTGKFELVRPSHSADHEVRLLYSTVEAMLKRLDENLDDQKRFISDASHEIRAPLTNLRVALDVCLRRRRSAEEYLEVLEVCQAEVVRLGLLAERLLTLNRIDSGLYRLERRTVELNQAVEAALEACALRAKEHELEIRFRASEPVVVHCDPTALRQVLDNLLDNALRHAPRATEVELEVATDPDQAVVTIGNRGCLLTAEQSEKVFDRFYRLDASRQRDTGGAGLGLAIVAGFVSAHGGKTGVQLGDHTKVTFWFTLPV